jgi:hypothetical protein
LSTSRPPGRREHEASGPSRGAHQRGGRQSKRSARRRIELSYTAFATTIGRRTSPRLGSETGREDGRGGSDDLSPTVSDDRARAQDCFSRTMAKTLTPLAPTVSSFKWLRRPLHPRRPSRRTQKALDRLADSSSRDANSWSHGRKLFPSPPPSPIWEEEGSPPRRSRL